MQNLDDEFNQTAWTVNGRIGDLDVIYQAFLDREVTANIDYTGYNIRGFISGYQCEYLVGYYNGLYSDASTFTFDPTIGGDPRL